MKGIHQKGELARRPLQEADLIVVASRLFVTLVAYAAAIGRPPMEVLKSIQNGRGDPDHPLNHHLFIKAPDGLAGVPKGTILIAHRAATYMSTHVRQADLRERHHEIDVWFKAAKSSRLKVSSGDIDWKANHQYLEFARKAWELGCTFSRIAFLLKDHLGVGSGGRGVTCGLISNREKWGGKGFVRGKWSHAVETRFLSEYPKHGANEADDGQNNSATRDNPNSAYEAEDDKNEPEGGNVGNETEERPGELVPIVFNKAGIPMTTSVLVAKAYGKRHNHVLRDIKNLTDPKLGPLFLFIETKYLDDHGESRTMFEMNQQAFTLLTFGFTGPKGLRFRVSHIEEFDRMKKHIEATNSAGSTDVVPMMAMFERIIEKGEERQERSEARYEALVGRLIEAMTSINQPRQEEATQGQSETFSKGSMAFKTFAKTQGVTVAWFVNLLGTDASPEHIRGGGGLIIQKKFRGDWRWVCTDAARRAETPLVEDATDVYVGAQQMPYARLTSAGVDHFIELFARIRTYGPLQSFSDWGTEMFVAKPKK